MNLKRKKRTGLQSKTGPTFSKSERDPDSLPGLSFGVPPMTLNVTDATMGEVASLLAAEQRPG